ncbi:MAG: molybdopterin-dependent oxidoreductase [Chloroflexota bacterium]|nr:molybdopterin-dependent oxidoreductase [Chloroflexota bacterium]
MTESAAPALYGVPRSAQRHAAHPILRVEGLVDHPLALTPADLGHLPRRPFVGSISCIQRGDIPDTDWSGFEIADLLALASPLPEARFVRVCAGPYATPIALDVAAQALLCDQLGGEELPLERGGPWRLVIPETRYYTSVKWVDLLEITAEPPDNSAERLARARNRPRNE